MTISQLKQFSEAFLLPILVLVSIIAYCILYILNFKTVGTVIILAGVFAGSFDMVKETIQSLIKKQFALDYIAIIAILVAIITGQYLVAGILALMISSGTTLENYGVNQAKRSLTQLIERIPQEVTLWIANAPDGKEKIRDVKVGTHIFVRKGEVIPLDGILLSDIGETDESSLTGEPYFISKNKGDEIRSGTVNIGQPMVIEVTKKEEESTYHKIINLVKSAQDEKSPFIRLADKYSTIFTIVTFSIAGVAFVISGGSLDRVLAVLAVATPCPLIIATPIALLGGMNASAKQKIIIKKLASLEVLARINTIVFDKTGTITLGKPVISSITVEKGITEEFALSIASAIERNSLHPLAKAIVSEAQQRKIKHQTAHQVKEIIGKGITGVVQNKEYSLSKLKERQGMAIELLSGKKKLAVFTFTDEIKEESKQIIKLLKDQGLSLFIFTGDKKEAAEKVLKELGENIQLKADCSPKDKQDGIKQLHREKKIVAMVGDGINDAPALALADVGIAFSNQEQTAATEAADIVLLGGGFDTVYSGWKIAKRSITIAKQSINWGIGLSVVAMVFAAIGSIHPIFGAGIQECIDVAVIINALRASKS